MVKSIWLRVYPIRAVSKVNSFIIFSFIRGVREGIVMSEVDIQEKKANRKKDLIKDFAIAFLAIMLVLTFFSNTIMNYTLPEVATQMVQSGKVSPKIRGTGTVEADDPYSIMVSETRKIASVAVKVGDHVSKDDVIYYLEDKESDELEEARKTLDELELAYEQSLFSGDIPDDVITNVRSGRKTTYDTYQTEIKAAEDKYQAAKAADDAAQAVVDYYTNLAAADAAENSYNTATPEYMKAELDYEIVCAQQAGDTERVNELTKQKEELEKNKSQLSTYAAQMAAAYAYDLATATQEKTKTAQALKDAEQEKKDLLTSIKTEISLCDQRDKIAEQKEKVSKLESESVGASIKAPVDGIISSLGLVAGETTKADTAVAVIQIDGKAMTTSFSVTTAQAKKLKVGDIAEPQNSWYYTDFKATLTAIKADTSDPANKKVLVFTIESPEVTTGQSVSLQIGESSSDYDFTVPNSAIRQDSNGKFILIVNIKSSPLGNRYIAQRVDVEVLASDDTTSAISGSLEGYEYVITTTTSPITAGQQVRLANTNL
ncbi:MAG: HlyD family efflux transporter periplasmic adaptor subunit [Butyrivibrio sp.]|jgi:multidrug efflux pump subunit AcrA (membrane-fusion protein)|nr:HlyD family efflux transporter periplasmic adaptor subunit [Butyrivibrio sp.]